MDSYDGAGAAVGDNMPLLAAGSKPSLWKRLASVSSVLRLRKQTVRRSMAINLIPQRNVRIIVFIFFYHLFFFFFPSLLFSSVVCIKGWKCTRVMARGCLGECDGGRGGGGEGDVLSTREEKECVKHFS